MKEFRHIFFTITLVQRLIIIAIALMMVATVAISYSQRSNVKPLPQASGDQSDGAESRTPLEEPEMTPLTDKEVEENAPESDLLNMENPADSSQAIVSENAVQGQAIEKAAPNLPEVPEQSAAPQRSFLHSAFQSIVNKLP